MLTVVSANFLGDAILSIGLLIAFYYGITGLACVWYFRRRLSGSVRDLFLKGVLPALGGLIMLAAFARSAHDMIAPTTAPRPSTASAGCSCSASAPSFSASARCSSCGPAFRRLLPQRPRHRRRLDHHLGG